MRVKHLGDASSANEVEVTYARGGKVYTAHAKNAILACWHVVIPYICDELPEKQKEALASAQKVPLLYTNVLLTQLDVVPEGRRQFGLCSRHVPLRD